MSLYTTEASLVKAIIFFFKRHWMKRKGKEEIDGIKREIER